MDTTTIATALRREIEAGRLLPGTVLKQELLAKRFGVSRQPVRQALDRLLASGLLDRRPDRSLAVVGLTEEQARELADIRAALESMALRGALPTLGGSDLRKAQRLNEDLVEEEDPATLEELDVAFHRTLYGRCGNARLLSMIDELRRESRRAYSRQPKGSDERIILHAEHRAIIDACARRDEAAALQALSDHLQMTTARLTREGE
ncbi:MULTISPECIES: GntR family transcriptional regulator [unclassified Rhizobium]|uniref:GntR family transcriptional regulator n=1 Tax=unclassified Rhizobium TaxID=2613769 RepID=UPI001053123F|nr:MULTISPECIES: GntR family transcriptional regulator [unclassified Rhizobium]MBB3397733.1 DNA-binding GntR family transcriptional regulator [Rhizobium sp. BK060]MBB4170931.1 DNA-binding GntR family transcriptional regulator [Rhizobium sp. BK538]TCM75371.1 GntR family transcriptional regulator [Rhizobium sp. BK068]